MDGNRDEAQRAFKLAQSYHGSDPQKALKFARKACALYWSPESAALVRALEKGEGPSTGSSNLNEKTSATSSSANLGSEKENLRSRASNSTPRPSVTTEKKETGNYKPAQLEIVQKVRRCKVTQYYEILQLKKDCDEGQVKSAYRKLALALHPDKNNAPGADEAFKMVSKAFQVLSDPEKRASFDRHGADPDSRSAGFSNGPSFGHSNTHFAHEDAIDPDQLFRMFFGGGGFGGFDGPGVQFGAGPTIFQFGNGRTTFRRAGPGMRAQNQRAQHETPEARTPTAWMSFLPILIFFAISLIQSFSSLFSTPSIPDPTISWNPNSLYSIKRVTHGPSSIKYFVNQAGFATHPMYEAYLKANPSLGFKPSNPSDKAENSPVLRNELVKFLPKESKLLIEMRSVDRQRLKLPTSFKKFEQSVEATWIRKLQSECQHARDIRDNEKRNLMGFLGIGADWEAIRKLDAEKIPACEGLIELGYLVD
ncbi:hypothetical protein PPACK8108_LOCUS2626 [Phakopsora pachyrhizi]|uniref:J domain-containing protein n=1 Tax=Phakopsora pachyrhizi TaxID=170000 RepID=A0AAV0AKR4_PHAPC|nr:hypothetical protein PPACK8108_LOCUS2626 [Phakopsora pachyrhizi]